LTDWKAEKVKWKQKEGLKLYKQEDADLGLRYNPNFFTFIPFSELETVIELLRKKSA